ncbi:iron chelate uptake ABC transporter family permease subunit [Streptomyces sp. CA-111067]|uniref:iron chelate uptake ABC transporter family permease subunit n=1 Tax=Streptomyces sp. CA-111067 TaxID=3240046 RepID=UPI003D95FB38
MQGTIKAVRGTPGRKSWSSHSTGRRAAGLVLAGLTLLVIVVLSLAVGTREIPLHEVFDAVFHNTDTDDQLVVTSLRVPRTLIGLCVGASLGLAGALIQALTRNPLADPGLLGVNSGAAAAIVIGIAWLGLDSPWQYVWLGVAGAALVSCVVYLLGSRGTGRATPARLALAGIAVTAVLTGLVQAITLLSPAAFDAFRFWQVGSLDNRGTGVLRQVLPLMAAGTVLGLALVRPLNAMALGEEAGRALGAHPARTRLLGALAITLLCGSATAAVGPIVFVGLAVPHIARGIVGPDQRWVLPYSLVLAPTVLLAADIVGRVVARPGELQAGMVTAFLGAPVLIALVRRGKVSSL